MLDDLDVVGSHLQLLGGFRHGVPAQQAELEHTPISWGKSGEDACDPVIGLATFDSRRLGLGDRADVEFVDRQHGAVAVVRAPMVRQHRSGDGKEPAGDRCFRTAWVELASGLEERLGRQVFGVLLVADPRIEEAVDRLEVVRRSVPGLPRGHLEGEDPSPCRIRL